MNLSKWPKTVVYPTIASLCVIAFFAIYFNASSTSCTFKVSGTLKVKIQAEDNFEDEKKNLRGVGIKVSGAGMTGLWNTWETTETNAYGEFAIEKNKYGTACTNGRKIKVEIKFKDEEDLSIYEKSFGFAKWHQIAYKPQGLCQNCVLGNLIFQENADEELGDETLRKHAELWFRLQKAIKLMNDDLGGDYAFTKRIEVVYPAFASCGGASYTTPSTQVIHLYNKQREKCLDRDEVDEEDLSCNSRNMYDDFCDDTIFHELAHAWAFQHSTGEAYFNGMGTYWCTHSFDTHGIVKQSRVAFQEGFAEYYGRYVYENLGFTSSTDDLLPFSRSYLYESGALGFDIACSNKTELGSLDCLDHGWLSIFNTIGLGTITLDNAFSTDLVDWDFNSSSSYIQEDEKLYVADYYDRPNIDFEQVLESFMANEDAGYDDELDSSEMNFDDYLKRLGAISGELDKDDIKRLKELMDPSETEQPDEIYLMRQLEITSVSGKARKENKGVFRGSFIVTVENIGSETSDEAWVFNFDDELFGSKMSYVDEIDAGESEKLRFNFSFTPNANNTFPITTLTWDVATLSQASADVKQDSYELEVGPDYRPKISIDDNDSDNYRDWIVSCVVTNEGNAPPGVESNLILSMSGGTGKIEFMDESSDTEIDSLGAEEESSTASIDMGSTTFLSHSSNCTISISCTADSDDAFTETDETNNLAEDEIDCSSASTEEEDPGFEIPEMDEDSEAF